MPPATQPGPTRRYCNRGIKTHLSIDPDSELIDEVVVTAANAADHDPIDELLAPVAENNDKPVIFGDCAYGDGDTLAHLEGQGFEVMAGCRPRWAGTAATAKTISPSISGRAR